MVSFRRPKAAGEPEVTPGEFVARLGRVKASAILRTDDQQRAAQAMEAAVEGGFRILEFTLSIPGAYELVREFSQREGVVVGTGTVMDEVEARQSVAAGARFIVSPVIDEAVIAAAGEMGVACMPGCNTPTEMLRAHRAGAPLCKLFPAPGSGAAWVRSVLAPMPWLKIVPTNGVDEHNAGQWLEAGAFAVGFVNTLFEPADIAHGDWDAIRQRAGRCLAACGGEARPR
jgi:Entner-Doudoroff aldolase